MKKLFALGLALVIGLSCLSPTEASASTSISNTDDFYSQVKVFDGDGHQIPYTVDEIKQIMHLETNNSNAMVPYALTSDNYGPMTFSILFWVGKGGTYGKAYYNPVDTVLTVNGTARAIKVKAYNDNGAGGIGRLAKTVELPSGWTGSVHMSAWSSLPRGKSYRFQIVNLDNRSFTINNVRVLYNN